MLSKITDRVMNGQGLVWKAGRFTGRQSLNYVRDFGRTLLFCLKSALMTFLLGAGIVGTNTMVSDSGYQFTFPTKTVSMVSATDSEVVITDGEVEGTYVLIGSSWLDSNMEAANPVLKEFLDKCMAYRSIIDKDSSREGQLTKPTLTSTRWLPNSVEYIKPQQ